VKFSTESLSESLALQLIYNIDKGAVDVKYWYPHNQLPDLLFRYKKKWTMWTMSTRRTRWTRRTRRTGRESEPGGGRGGMKKR
jgi:hypothetical protein